jgi:transcriptional antiterminator RfaH
MRWYVVYCQTRQEARADFNLRRQGFETWLPRLRQTRRHARRIDTVFVPLFPSYLFVSLDLDRQPWRSINGTYGVRRILCTNEHPSPVAKGFIETLQETVDENGLVAAPKDTFKCGDRVRLVASPFADMIGTLARLTDKDRVAVLLNVLGREVQALVSRRALMSAG